MQLSLCCLSDLPTCYLIVSSMLQCLSNTEAFTQYFLNGSWEEDLNETDVNIGAKGKMARAYAELLQAMWSGKYTSVVPRQLKQVCPYCMHSRWYQYAECTVTHQIAVSVIKPVGLLGCHTLRY